MYPVVSFEGLAFGWDWILHGMGLGGNAVMFTSHDFSIARNYRVNNLYMFLIY
jgi:hypothetical protein